MKTHESYMRLALDLATKGAGHVSPNPMVGCIIVKDGKIIGQGYHEQYGQPHAEPNAVNNVANKEDIKDSDVYVTLEPCSHYGKTPPCADLLASLNPKRVFIAAIDTNPLVGGNGVKILTAAGIEVISAILESESRDQNRRFFTAMEKKRPFVILKWAQTADGFIAGENFEQVKITNSKSSTKVHEMRSVEDAILVGFNTALHDNPSLTTRLVKGKNPLRLFIDKRLEIPSDHHLLDDSTPTVCYNLSKSSKEGNTEYVQLTDTDFARQIIEDLYSRKINSLMVEGGTELLNSFISQELWDEAYVFQSDKKLETGISAPILNSKPLSIEKIENDTLSIHKRN